MITKEELRRRLQDDPSTFWYSYSRIKDVPKSMLHEVLDELEKEQSEIHGPPNPADGPDELMMELQWETMDRLAENDTPEVVYATPEEIQRVFDEVSEQHKEALERLK